MVWAFGLGGVYGLGFTGPYYRYVRTFKGKLVFTLHQGERAAADAPQRGS